MSKIRELNLKIRMGRVFATWRADSSDFTAFLPGFTAEAQRAQRSPRASRATEEARLCI